MSYRCCWYGIYLRYYRLYGIVRPRYSRSQRGARTWCCGGEDFSVLQWQVPGCRAHIYALGVQVTSTSVLHAGRLLSGSESLQGAQFASCLTAGAALAIRACSCRSLPASDLQRTLYSCHALDLWLPG